MLLTGRTPCKEPIYLKQKQISTFAAALKGVSFLNVGRFEVNETMGTLTIVAYRNKGTYGNVSVFFYAQNLEAQQGLDYNTSETVRHAQFTR